MLSIPAAVARFPALAKAREADPELEVFFDPDREILDDRAIDAAEAKLGRTAHPLARLLLTLTFAADGCHCTGKNNVGNRVPSLHSSRGLPGQ